MGQLANRDSMHYPRPLEVSGHYSALLIGLEISGQDRMSYGFHKKRLDKFVKLYEANSLASQSLKKRMATAVEPIKAQIRKNGVFDTKAIIDIFPDEGMTRDQLQHFIAKQPTRIAILAILCWGHISAKSLRGYLLSSEDSIKEFENYVIWLKKSNPTRAAAYEKIAAMRKGTQRQHWRLQGVGVAYFTKVIFFFTRSSKKPGYIMDQFTARSTNFLLDAKIIKMDSGTVVTDRNSKDNYEAFCGCVEALASIVGEAKNKRVMPEQIEMAMFSGRSGKWRSYLTVSDEAGLKKKKKNNKTTTNKTPAKKSTPKKTMI